jgi:hypothetical protein
MDFFVFVKVSSTKGNKWRNIEGFDSNLVAKIGYIKVSKPSSLRGTFIVKEAKEVVDSV